MNLNKKTILDIDVTGKKVLVRCDFNVPTDENGQITDDGRIVKTLPTINYLLDHGAAVILCSHMGRPKNGYEEKYSLKVVAQRLRELLGKTVWLAHDVVGVDAQLMVSTMKPGDIVLLENVRFEPGETKNDDTLAKRYAAMADIYVNDAFGSSHRAHSSTAGVTKYLPAVAGLLIKKELDLMVPARDNPTHPFLLVMGGSKVSDKIGVIDYLLNKVDNIIIGGGMSYTFTKALGGEIGNSLFEEDSVVYCRKLMKKAMELGVRIFLPVDNVAADSFSNDAATCICTDGEVPEGMMGLDIGPVTTKRFCEVIEKAGTIVWNGPMGVFELPNFAEGTRKVAEAVANCQGISIIGGGDSAAAVEQFGLADKVSHVSTGGGASLDFFAGHSLPGIECLMDKDM